MELGLYILNCGLNPANPVDPVCPVKFTIVRSAAYFTGACPAVPSEIDINHSEAYFTGVAPADGTGVQIKSRITFIQATRLSCCKAGPVAFRLHLTMGLALSR